MFFCYATYAFFDTRPTAKKISELHLLTKNGLRFFLFRDLLFFYMHSVSMLGLQGGGAEDTTSLTQNDRVVVVVAMSQGPWTIGGDILDRCATLLFNKPAGGVHPNPGSKAKVLVEPLVDLPCSNGGEER